MIMFNCHVSAGMEFIDAAMGKGLRLKQAAQDLQSMGHYEAAWRNYEAALPLMLRSVSLRENSYTLCPSLSKLAELYLVMLKLSDAEHVCARMLEEAHRYDTENQTRIARGIMERVGAARMRRMHHGLRVVLHGLSTRTELNGHAGSVRGVQERTGRYMVQVGLVTYLLRSCNITPCYSVVQITSCAQWNGAWCIDGATVDGEAMSPLRCEELSVSAVRAAYAAEANCTAQTLQLIHPAGCTLQDGGEGDAQLLNCATLAGNS